MLFVLSDPHLSFGSGKPMDIFKGWDNYTQRLRKNWSAVVSDRDTVVLPGDISWAMDLNGAKEDFAFLDSLPGTKIIGKGNHDYWWATMRKMETFLSDSGFETIRLLFNNAYRVDDIAVCGTRGWFFDDVTEDVEKVLKREAGRLKTSIEAALALGGEPVAFLHYPVVYDGKVCEELFSVLKEYGIRRCYFGHIHGDRSGRYLHYEYDGIEFSLASADALYFCPRPVSAGGLAENGRKSDTDG